MPSYVQEPFNPKKTRRKHIATEPDVYYVPIGTDLYDENLNFMVTTTNVHRIKKTRSHESKFDHSQIDPRAIRYKTHQCLQTIFIGLMIKET
jgi:hypothetical protein